MAEIRRMHAERAKMQRKQEDTEMKGGEPAAKKGKVIGGKYFANPPKQIGMKEYESLINRYQRIQRQKKCAIEKIEVDSDTVMFFQSFLRAREFKVQRIAYMYGTVEGGLVKCHCCYEPEQESSQDGYKVLPDNRLAKADGIAALFGLQRVGVLVSAPPATPSDPVLTAEEVLLVANDQAKHGSHCCLVQVRLSEDLSEVKVEAYQASAQCVEIYKEGTLSANPKDTKLVTSERELEAVQEESQGSSGHKALVSKQPTHHVDTAWFTVPVPIGGFESTVVSNRFIRLNRPGEIPPTWENVKIFLKDPRRAGKAFAEQVRDYQLILFLSNWFDVKQEMPAFVAAAMASDPHAMSGFETTIKAYAGMI
eukprot:TRINITY_DN3014_c1_g1_i1.p1 TRINITY_DN3014_c1_g1~~TRINITY_DN3014_c1_g1_i1.p1  ORF type:complete len:385 (+),score=69.99 TRINITY_DN3014_c1_g1_i1:59-1156(+)